MANTASMFAKRMVEAERERLKNKERAARDMMEAVEALRAAAGRLRTAVGAYMAMDTMTRTRLGDLLGLTGVELRIAFDAKHELIREPADATEHDEHEHDGDGGGHAAAPSPDDSPEGAVDGAEPATNAQPPAGGARGSRYAWSRGGMPRVSAAHTMPASVQSSLRANASNAKRIAVSLSRFHHAR